MCLPACQKFLSARWSRRRFVKMAGLTAAVSATASRTESAVGEDRRISFRQVVDLTHPLDPDFPTWSGKPQLEIERVGRRDRDGFNFNRWIIQEHTGTHLDAPFHKSDGDTADRIPAAQLIGPLVVVDIRRKASESPDAQLTLDDLHHWERANRRIPPGAVVAMSSGWDRHVRTAKFRNADSDGKLRFPGFHVDAIEFLLAERNVLGIVVDTL